MTLISLLLALQGAGPEGSPAPASAPPAGTKPQGAFGMDMLVPILGFMVVFYFLMWRPQAREKKARAAMLQAIKKGDRVVLTCGLVGDVAALTEQEVFIRFDDKDPRRMRFKRFAIQGLIQGDDAPAAAALVEANAK